MTLVLTMLRCPNGVPPETRRIEHGELTIGRGRESGWMLPDPDRLLSKRHCTVTLRGNDWELTDISTNGTCLNHESDCLGQSDTRALRNGDRLILGSYEIEVALRDRAPLEQADKALPVLRSSGPADEDSGQGSAGQAAEESAEESAPGGIGLPIDPSRSDPFGIAMALPVGLRDDDPFASPLPAADHAPIGVEHFSPPAARFDILPTNWDQDFAPEHEPAGPPSAGSPPFEAPVPPPIPSEPTSLLPTLAVQASRVPAQLPPLMSPSAPISFPAAEAALPEPAASATANRGQAGTSRSEDRSPGSSWSGLSGPPIAAPAGGDGADKPGRDGKKEEPLRLDLLAVRSNAAPGPARATPPAPEQPGRVTPPSASAGLSAVDAYAVFLAGAGITAPAPADMAAALHDLGQAFRTVVSGLRQVIITRAAIKGEFRIEQTMIQSSGNNPLKFSADDDDALQALLGSRRLGDMPAERALDEAMRDLRTHEIAVSAAMQQATRDLLAALAPGCVERDLPGSPLDKLPGAGVRRKARSWNSYATLHARAMQALDDDFDSVFGKSFVRAYEQATADIDAQDGDGQHAAVPRRVK